MTASRFSSAGRLIAAGVFVALVLAFGVSRYASGDPDGLERVAADTGIDADARDHSLADGPFADYATTGIDDEGLSTGVAGAIGVGVTFVIAAGLVWVSRRVAGADRTPPVDQPAL